VKAKQTLNNLPSSNNELSRRSSPEFKEWVGGGGFHRSQTDIIHNKEVIEAPIRAQVSISRKGEPIVNEYFDLP